jgi:predicted glycoside hydrolase/deacetylase ChbG (UPF0249 family)
MVPEVNGGILRGHLEGIVSSASLMVRGSAATHAADIVRNGTNLSVGLHLDLGEWSFRNGDWHCNYQVVPLDNEIAISDEINRQIDAFHRLMGRPPTHIDSHQHVHRREPVRSILLKRAKATGLPIRGEGSIQYCGSFYGQTAIGEPLGDAIAVPALLKVLRSLQPGVTELACHPGVDGNIRSAYASERPIELETLCDQRVRHALESERIVLCSFADIPLQTG